MRATFTTNDPFEIQRILNSYRMASALWEILRNLPKRTEQMMENITDPYDAHEKIWEAIREEVNFDIDSMIE